MNFDMVARICHNVNRVWCAVQGDFSQPTWDEAPDWQKDSARKGVEFIIANPDAGDSALHDNWAKDKIADGWVYGDVKDPETKTHPCLVAFEMLPIEQQIKDALFRTIVLSAIGRDQ